MNNDYINNLTKIFSRLPGLGPRSARRLVLTLLENKETTMQPLIQALQVTKDNIISCDECGNLCTQNPCSICASPIRDNQEICIIETVADLWALERSSSFKGKYHVLGGVMSAIDGVTPSDLNLTTLRQRIKNNDIKEVILALSATIDGQTTAHYISDMIKDIDDIKITAISHGVPIGGELDYLDDGTISTAIKSRRSM